MDAIHGCGGQWLAILLAASRSRSPASMALADAAAALAAGDRPN